MGAPWGSGAHHWAKTHYMERSQKHERGLNQHHRVQSSSGGWVGVGGWLADGAEVFAMDRPVLNWLILGSLWSAEAIWDGTRVHLGSDLSLETCFVLISCAILGLSPYFSEPQLSHL